MPKFVLLCLCHSPGWLDFSVGQDRKHIWKWRQGKGLPEHAIILDSHADHFQEILGCNRNGPTWDMPTIGMNINVCLQSR